DLAHHYRDWHWRHAGLDQCDGGGILECEKSAHGDCDHGGRLPDRRSHWRDDSWRVTRDDELARGVLFWHCRDDGNDSAGVFPDARVSVLADAQTSAEWSRAHKCDDDQARTCGAVSITRHPRRTQAQGLYRYLQQNP